ncbi:IQ motif, EF-hand binding site [Dillenia turbinata]|uniref:IQ motif, EF-hand binding site n=1 Tax=Dillenia turbinata TaxID=194707 RepID=A0AAN8U738_9MAGN
MGKASKWITSFLLGKKETDKKKEDTNSDNTRTSTAIVARAPKRRWSFGRSANKQVHHRRTRSTSFSSNTLAKHESEKSNYDKAIVILPNANVKQTTILMQKVKAREAEVAAIKIQAVFRAYLARKALHALRGLVKLQALIRGYLVRKQATATFRCMHSLMSIQVRTRVLRIQMAEEAETLAKRQWIHRRSTEGNQHNQVYNVSFH